MAFRNHEYFSSIAKDKSCSFVSVGQDVGSCMEAVYEALWQRGIYPSDVFGYQGLMELVCRDGTSIPKGSTIYCTDAPCIIGKKVLFGPRPTIITGDHRIDIFGKYITDVTVEEKFVDGVNVYDQPVVIEDGVWCGANVTILKGVTIGRGSVVAAGAVVTKSFPPYSIIGGIPAKLIKMRFTEEEIKKNENDLSLSAHSI